MNPPTPCPEANELGELLAGRLSESDQATLADHLETCEICRKALEGMAGGSELLSGLRGGPEGEEEPDTALKDAMDRLKDDRGTAETMVTSSTAGDLSLDFLAPSDNPEHLGRLGVYDVLEVVGRGGMGVVLKGLDRKLQRVVAIKLLAPELASNATARQRFQREARAAAAVSHDHVVTIHAVEESDRLPGTVIGLPYLVMEYISGRSLQEQIEATGPLELKEILRIGMQTASGLAAAHALGLVHRDIKPANILLENHIERVKITDFGLARAVDDVGMTQSGVVAGTPQYTAPEQARGEAVDHRADLFSLGCVMYAMSAGRSPFRAESTMAAIRRICEDTPGAIHEVNPDVPDGLARIIGRLLAKDPAQRFQSAAEVAELLGKYLAHVQQPSMVPRPADLEMETADFVPHRPKRSRGRAVAAGAVLLLLLGGLIATESTGVTNVREFFATVLRIRTPEGTLVVEIGDTEVDVTIDGEEITLTNVGPHEIRLSPGRHQLRATKDGAPVQTEWVTITRDGKEVVKVDFERGPEAAAGAGEAAPPPAIAPFDAATAKRHQQAWADYRGVPVEQEIDLGDGVNLTMVLIPPGEFLMGSTPEEQAAIVEWAKAASDQWHIDRIASEGPQHRVRITKPFRLSRHEVTRGQFRQFVEGTGYRTEAERDGKGAHGEVDGKWVRDSRFVWSADSGFEQTDDHPVVNVSWNDALAFCQWLSEEKERVNYTLPSEAQWEYACRAGTITFWHCGHGEAVLQEYAWCNANSGGKTHPVGELLPNGFGLSDLHGNVWEWCADWWGAIYYAESPPNDPNGPLTGSTRVRRGGSWDFHPKYCRSAHRNHRSPSDRNSTLGFRVAGSIEDTLDWSTAERPAEKEANSQPVARPQTEAEPQPLETEQKPEARAAESAEDTEVSADAAEKTVAEQPEGR